MSRRRQAAAPPRFRTCRMHEQWFNSQWQSLFGSIGKTKACGDIAWSIIVATERSRGQHYTKSADLERLFHD